MYLLSVVYLAATAGVSTRPDDDEAVLHIPVGNGHIFLVAKRVWS